MTHFDHHGGREGDFHARPRRHRREIQAGVLAAMSGVLGFIWFLLIFLPVDWLYTDNLVFCMRVTLWSVRIGDGGASGQVGEEHGFGVAKRGLRRAIKQVFGRTTDGYRVGMRIAVRQFCSEVLENAFHWCGEWHAVMWGATIMCMCAFCAMVCMLIAAVCGYFYANEYSDHQGHQVAKFAVILAPCFAMIGIVSFGSLTAGFGDFNHTKGIGEPYNVWGVGFIFSVFTSVASIGPGIIFSGYKVAYFQKKKDEREIEMQPPARLDYELPPQPPVVVSVTHVAHGSLQYDDSHITYSTNLPNTGVVELETNVVPDEHVYGGYGGYGGYDGYGIPGRA